MPESYGWETIEAACELYIIDGLTFEQTATRTGVSVAQLKRWSSDSAPTWPERRREYRQAQVSVRHGVMLAKAKLIEAVLDTQDPQKAFAFNSLVSAGRAINEEARERAAAAPAPVAPALPELPDQPVDVIEALGKALNTRIGTLLSQPGAITLTAIKELQQALALLEKLKAETLGAEGKNQGTSAGISEETINTIRRDVLRMSV